MNLFWGALLVVLTIAMMGFAVIGMAVIYMIVMEEKREDKGKK